MSVVGSYCFFFPLLLLLLLFPFHIILPVTCLKSLGCLRISKINLETSEMSVDVTTQCEELPFFHAV